MPTTVDRRRGLTSHPDYVRMLQYRRSIGAGAVSTEYLCLSLMNRYQSRYRNSARSCGSPSSRDVRLGQPPSWRLAREWFRRTERRVLDKSPALFTTVLAIHFRDFGFWSDVRDLYRQALTIYRHLDDRRGEMLALWGLGEVERRIGEYGHAREYHTEALALARHLDDRSGGADALRGLGEVERLVGEYGQAREYHTEALALARHLGDRFGEVDALWGLGEVEWFVSEYSQAREYYTQALAPPETLVIDAVKSTRCGGSARPR